MIINLRDFSIDAMEPRWTCTFMSSVAALSFHVCRVGVPSPSPRPGTLSLPEHDLCPLLAAGLSGAGSIVTWPRPPSWASQFFSLRGRAGSKLSPLLPLPHAVMLETSLYLGACSAPDFGQCLTLAATLFSHSPCTEGMLQLPGWEQGMWLRAGLLVPHSLTDCSNRVHM
jgi:hypothetical protein